MKQTAPAPFRAPRTVWSIIIGALAACGLIAAVILHQNRVRPEFVEALRSIRWTCMEFASSSGSSTKCSRNSRPGLRDRPASGSP